MRQRLEFVYGPEKAPGIMHRAEEIIERYRPLIPDRDGGRDERDVLLITYADSVVEPAAAPLRTLDRFLRERVGDLMSLVHLLPFYPYSSDDGFAVQDFRRVRDELGDWEDIERLAESYRLAFDAVINHVSASSVYAKGYLGGDPQFEDFFIELDPDTNTSSVLRTRDEPLLHDYETADGETRWLWTTFSRDQIDLNFRSPRVLLETLEVLLFYAQHGASVLRLDAIPYLWKRLGTSCAHLPRTHALIKFLRDAFDAAAPHVLLMAECNVPQPKNFAYLGEGGDESQIVYNFTLPPLIVFALLREDAGYLTEWAKTVPYPGENATYLNITATHDGIGMRPTEGLLSEEERQELMDLAFARGGDVTGKRNSDGSISPYELNVTYFDAVNDPNDDEPLERQVRRFMLSQAIAMSFIGIPAVYIHSLVGSRNYLEGVRRTGRARSINREQLHREELEDALEDPSSRRSMVYRRYCEMLEVRRRESAFHPSARQEVLDLGPEIFALRRHNQKTGGAVVALHNVTGSTQEVATEGPANGEMRDLLTGERFGGETVELGAYQVRWMKV